MKADCDCGSPKTAVSSPVRPHGRPHNRGSNPLRPSCLPPVSHHAGHGASGPVDRSSPPLPSGLQSLLAVSTTFATPLRPANPFDDTADDARRCAKGRRSTRSLGNTRRGRRRRRLRMSPLLSRTARASDSVKFDARELRRATSISLVPIDHGLCLPHITCLDEVEFGWLYWRQAKKPFSQDTLEYIAALDGEADAQLLRAALGSRMREGCLATLRLSTLLLKRGAAAGLTLHAIASIIVRDRQDTPSMLEQVVAAARGAAAAKVCAAGGSIGANGIPENMSERQWYDSVLAHAPKFVDTAVQEAAVRFGAKDGSNMTYNRFRSTTL